jgi:RNA polymerase sigma-B factor
VEAQRRPEKKPPRALPPREPEGGEAAAQRARETARLIDRFYRHGDQRARDQLIERFLPLARQLARRYHRASEPFDDLVQVASMGLVKAVDRFDPDRGVAFSSYAVPTILGELKRYFRDAGWSVHVPRGLQERVMQVDQAVRRLSVQLGRAPSVAEIAAAIQVPEEEVLEAMQASNAYDAVSLEAKRDPEGDGDSFADTMGREDERFELVEFGASMQPTIDALPDRDRMVLKLRFVDDMTQSEIAERIGVSQMQVSRLIRRALARLRTVAEAQ